MILKCFSVCECKSAAACLPMLLCLPWTRHAAQSGKIKCDQAWYYLDIRYSGRISTMQYVLFRYTTQAKSTRAQEQIFLQSMCFAGAESHCCCHHPPRRLRCYNFHPSPTNNKYSQCDAFSAPPWPRHQHCINKESSFGTEYNGA